MEKCNIGWKPIDTADTTRVLGSNPFEFNTYATKMIYPSAEVEWRPNAVILVPLTTYHWGLLASPVIHFPNNSPILFTHPNYLPAETLREILRLAPTGQGLPAQVLVVGPVSGFVERQLLDYGLSTVRITGADSITAAGEAMEFRYQIPPNSEAGVKNIMLVSAEDFAECIPAAYFSAHMGVPILFVFYDSIPEVTRKKLTKYSDKNVFIIGSQRTVSDVVYREVKSLVKGYVDRIGGKSPAEVAVNFAKYHYAEGEFGWNMNRKDGWSFCFGLVNNWPMNLAACIFAHLAKHTPLLFVEPYGVSGTTQEYVLALNPMEKHPPGPPFMHGYILGGFDVISYRTQVKLEEVLILRAGG